MKLLILLLLLSSNAFADLKTYSFKDYKEASKAKEHLRFDMKSTKLGMFTTQFSGYVKKYTVEYTASEQGFQSVTLKFPVKEMDTDIDGRNEKMWQTCLAEKEHPEISISFPQEILFGESLVQGEINIRGQTKPISVSVVVTKDGDRTTVKGHAEMSLKDLEIPDPSIAIASVDDKVRVDFEF